MSDFPETIERWCCPGKSCGNTALKLVTEPSFDGTVNYYEYVRVSNGDNYSGELKSEQQMTRWLEETKDHIQEEMDKDPSREFEVWELYAEYSRIPVGTVSLAFSDAGVEFNIKERDYIRESSIGKFTDDIYDIPAEHQDEYFHAQAEVARADARLEFRAGTSKTQKEWQDSVVDNLMVVYGDIHLLSVGGPDGVSQNATDESDVTDEFLEKQQKLSAFLLELATGLPWDHEEAIEMHGNYTADANDILRSNPHLLGLDTRDIMRLDGDTDD